MLQNNLQITYTQLTLSPLAIVAWN